MKRRSLVMLLTVFLAACAGLLGIRPQRLDRPFEHRAHVLKGISCVQCHTTARGAGDKGLVEFPTTATCVACHKKPHDSRACNTCHGEARLRTEATMAREHLRFSHERHTTRVGGQCVPCHAAVGKADATTLRPPMAQCFSCHAHRDQWSSRQCDACHIDLPAENIKPSSHVIHDGDFMREHGVAAGSAKDLCSTCHTEHYCVSCHGVTVAALPWKFAIEKPGLSGLHRAGFRLRHAEEARANTNLCATCHEPTSFCAECHAQNHVGAALGSKSPHPPGWVRARGGEHGKAARLDPFSCASCHGGAGEALCVGCHKVGAPGGNPHGPGFSSRQDKFRDLPCRQCHAP